MNDQNNHPRNKRKNRQPDGQEENQEEGGILAIFNRKAEDDLKYIKEDKDKSSNTRKKEQESTQKPDSSDSYMDPLVLDLKRNAEKLFSQENTDTYSFPVPGHSQVRESPKPILPAEKVIKGIAKDFVRQFVPWRGAFTQGNDYGLSDWITVQKPLHYSLIQRALKGEKVVGFYSTFNTPVIGIDIDDHGFPSYSDEQRLLTDKTKTIYNQIVHKVGYEPSLISKSPNGLHVYYLLTERLHWKHLQNLTRNLIGDTQVELKPTPRTTLRIPSLPNILDPETLQPITTEHELFTDWGNLKHYSPEQLFGSSWREIQRSLHFNKRKRTSSKEKPAEGRETPYHSLDLTLLEQTILPFKNNHTYTQVFELTVACRREGMTRDEILEYLQQQIAHSPSYIGSLRTEPSELEGRVDHILSQEGSRSVLPSITEENTTLLEMKPLIEYLLSIHPFSAKANKAVERLLTRLIIWKEWHDQIFTSPEATSLFDSLYPFYRKNRADGLYPLPSSLLKRWVSRYNKFIPWLQEKGILTESPYPYSSNAHICKYFRISFEHLWDEVV